MLRSLALAISLLLLGGCDEPDHWEARTEFGGNEVTGAGPGATIRTRSATLVGVVNAPVAPEAITLGIGGLAPGVTVLDLNGFGQGTGDTASTRFPLNPNIGQPGVTPPLAPGVTNLDAGGAGALTLTQDSLGGTLLLDGAIVGDASDLQIGQPLDLVFHNENINVNVRGFNQVNPATGFVTAGNTIMVAPHPNPPRLVFPPPNPGMGIEAEEPSVATSSQPTLYPFQPVSPPCLLTPLNLLTPGNPFSSQAGIVGIFAASFPGVFYGPQPAPPNPPPPQSFCPFVSRQQIGHFLYILDRVNRRVVAVNSNRFTVLAGISMPDPIDLAMAPNLGLLAVSNAATGDVRFIDTDPRSITFHTVVALTRLSPGITAMAWQPEGEDLLVCNPKRNTLSLIDARGLQVRKTVTRGLRRPMAVAVSARQTTFGFSTGTWFGYLLNDDGSVSVFESGPAGVGGIGYDDVLGTVPGVSLANARSIHADPALGTGFWVTHADRQGLGQVSRLELVQAPSGPQPLPPAVPADDGSLSLRGKMWQVTARYGGLVPTTPVQDLLTGNAPVDLAFDDIVNQGAWPDQVSTQVPGLRYANHSGKGLVKIANGTVVAARSPRLMFVALADVGRVDVIDLATGQRLASVRAPGIRALCDYWRQ